MGLVNNGYRVAFSPFQSRGGAAGTLYTGLAPRNYCLPGKLRGWGMNTSRQVALPMGNLAPHTWMLPQTGGGMSMRPTGHGTISVSLIPSRAMAVDLTGAGDLEAAAALVVAMALALAGAGDLAATIEGRLNASIDLSGSGDLSAGMEGFANMLVDLLGQGDLEATIAAIGNMAIDVVVTGSGLSTANVGQAVWAALAASNNAAGTMGEKLNDAGSASNPWTEVIESGLTAAEILRLIAAAMAGDAVGLEGASPVFKSLDGSKDRITATYVSGARTITGRDAS